MYIDQLNRGIDQLNTGLIYQNNLSKKNFSAHFRPIFDFKLSRKGHEQCRAELKIPQLGSNSSLLTTYLPTSNFVQFWQSYLFNDVQFWLTYPLPEKIAKFIKKSLKNRKKVLKFFPNFVGLSLRWFRIKTKIIYIICTRVVHISITHWYVG